MIVLANRRRSTLPERQACSARVSTICLPIFVRGTAERSDGDELVATYRALSEAIVENKPMTRKNHARVAEYLREAAAAA